MLQNVSKMGAQRVKRPKIAAKSPQRTKKPPKNEKARWRPRFFRENCPPEAPQGVPQTEKNHKNEVQKLICWGIGSWIQFFMIFRWKMVAKTMKNQEENLKRNLRRWRVTSKSGSAENTVKHKGKHTFSKIQKDAQTRKTAKKQQKTEGKCGSRKEGVPGPIFHWFWVDFESILGSKWVQNPFQRGVDFQSKKGSKTNTKKLSPEGSATHRRSRKPPPEVHWGVGGYNTTAPFTRYLTRLWATGPANYHTNPIIFPLNMPF